MCGEGETRDGETHGSSLLRFRESPTNLDPAVREKREGRTAKAHNVAYPGRKIPADHHYSFCLQGKWTGEEAAKVMTLGWTSLAGGMEGEQTPHCVAGVGPPCPRDVDGEAAEAHPEIG